MVIILEDRQVLLDTYNLCKRQQESNRWKLDLKIKRYGSRSHKCWMRARYLLIKFVSKMLDQDIRDSDGL